MAENGNAGAQKCFTEKFPELGDSMVHSFQEEIPFSSNKCIT